MKIKKFENISENSDILIQEFKDKFNFMFDDLLVSNLKLEEREDGYYQFYCDINAPIKTVYLFNKLLDIFDTTDCVFNFLNNLLSVKIYNLEDFINKM